MINATTVSGMRGGNGRLRPWPIRLLKKSGIPNFDKSGSVDQEEYATFIQANANASHEWAMSVANLLLTLKDWDRSGRQSFCVAPLMVEALTNTSLSKIPCAALRLPYEIIWVEANLKLPGMESSLLGFFLETRMIDHGDHSPDEIKSLPKGTQVLMACGVTNDERYFSAATLLWRQTLEECISECDRFSNAFRERQLLPPIPALTMECERAFWCFAANFLLYLSSPDPDLEPVLPEGLSKPPKSVKAREIQEKIRRREGSVQAVGYRLTKVIKTSGVLAKFAAGEQDQCAKTPCVHLVRGHWKQQIYGPGRIGRKTVWIAPYRRGDDGSEERIERTYTL